MSKRRRVQFKKDKLEAPPGRNAAPRDTGLLKKLKPAQHNLSKPFPSPQKPEPVSVSACYQNGESINSIVAKGDDVLRLPAPVFLALSDLYGALPQRNPSSSVAPCLRALGIDASGDENNAVEATMMVLATEMVHRWTVETYGDDVADDVRRLERSIRERAEPDVAPTLLAIAALLHALWLNPGVLDTKFVARALHPPDENDRFDFFVHTDEKRQARIPKTLVTVVPNVADEAVAAFDAPCPSSWRATFYFMDRRKTAENNGKQRQKRVTLDFPTRTDQLAQRLGQCAHLFSLAALKEAGCVTMHQSLKTKLRTA